MVIIETFGNTGKSAYSKYLEASHKADYCPVISNDINDYTGYCLKYPADAYCFDIPRAVSIKQANAMWSGIEMIKNGCLYERRYHPEKKWIEPPKIIIFTNEEPDLSMLSRDRWVIRYIQPGDWDKVHLTEDLTPPEPPKKKRRKASAKACNTTLRLL